METVLEQNAIDSLFTILEASRAPDALAASTPSTAYNFRRAEHIGADQMRAITLVNEQFARNLSNTLGAWLRTQLHAVAAPGEQMAFGDFLACLPQPSYVCLLRLEPLGGVALLELNLTVAMSMIDLLLGGSGAGDMNRDVTEIEDEILQSVLQMVMRELNTAWKMTGLSFTLENHETQGRMERLMPANEQTLCLSVDLQMPGSQGLLNFCLPSVVLNTIQRRLSVSTEQPRKRTVQAGMRIEQLMGDALVTALVRFPVMRIGSREVQTLAVGKVLELPLSRGSQAEVLIGGIRLCGALPVMKSGRLGAKLQGNELELAAAAKSQAGRETVHDDTAEETV